MVTVLFLKRNTWFSRLIRWATGSEASHCALVANKVLYHSNLLGVQTEDPRYLLSLEDVVHVVNVPIDPTHIEDQYLRYAHSMYDFTGFLFSGVFLILHKLLSVPLPTRNMGRITGTFLCTEWITEVILDRDTPEDAMLTPDGLYNILRTMYPQS